MKGITVPDSSKFDYYGVLEEILKVEYLGEPIKHCVLFCCDWFDPSNLRGTPYSKTNYTYAVNHQCRYGKYEPFVLADVVYQVCYIPYPSGDPNMGCIDKPTKGISPHVQ